MKKILTIAAALLIAAAASAQEKGDIFVGGNLGFSTRSGRYIQSIFNKDTKKEDRNTTPYRGGISFTFAPEAGFFVMDNLKLGAALGIGVATTPTTYFNGKGDEVDAIDTDFTFSLGIGVNYYLELFPAVYYTPGLWFGGHIGSRSEHQRLGGEVIKYTLSGVSARVDMLAMEFRPTPHLGFSVNAGGFVWDLDSVTYDDKDVRSSNTDSGVYFNLLRDVTLGVRYYF